MSKTENESGSAKKRQTVALPADLIDLLDQMADKEDRSRAYVATRLLRATLSADRKAS